MTHQSTPSSDLDVAIALDSVQESEPETTESPTSESWLEIPEPDADNITVLTHNLPNKPILPWNHYDSPWEKPEQEEAEEIMESEPEAVGEPTENSDADIEIQSEP